jgi:phosphoesterase RecJ-like protein
MEDTNIQQLKEIISGPTVDALVVSHNNPDGDAIGSALALGRLLEERGHRVTCLVPNRFPYFLSWMADIGRMHIFKFEQQAMAQKIAAAQVIFCVDFNNVGRLETLTPVLEANTTARRVLIDHHPQPGDGFDVVISQPEASSTSFLLYTLIEQMYGTAAVDYPMAEALYVGIMTDTGNFSFSNLSPALFRAVAVLVEKGVDIPRINSLVYNSFTEGRMRLVGHALGRKMEIVEPHKAAYITLTEAELRRFNFQVGDTEGIVNLPLSIENMTVSALFVQTRSFIRISLRSKGNVDVNQFARKYFQGGGHKNAAGGKSFVPMGPTIAHFRKALDEFFGPADPTQD